MNDEVQNLRAYVQLLHEQLAESRRRYVRSLVIYNVAALGVILALVLIK